MLKKLLKYDFKAMLKYWWIAAVSSLALSVIGGLCISVISTEKELPSIVYAVSTLLIIIVIMGFIAFSILSMIFIFMRVYRNFFTDEGYLTFTLPVSKNQLLLSKLISSGVTTLMTSAVLITDILVMIAISLGEEIFTEEFWRGFKELIESVIDSLGIYAAVYTVEIILALTAYTIFSILLLFFCLTVGSIITRKAKIITSIGIYYGVTSVIGIITQIFALFGISSIEYWLTDLSIGEIKATVALIILGITLFIAMLCMILYSMQYRMLDRKLNLS